MKDLDKIENSVASIREILHAYEKRHDINKLSQMLGIKYGTMAMMLNPNQNYDLGVSRLPAFLNATKETWKERNMRGQYDFALLDHIETMMGRVAKCLELPPKYDFSFKGLSRLIKESGEATRTISDAFNDGKVTPEEAADCIKELNDVIQISVQLIQALEVIQQEGKDKYLK